MAYLWGKCGPLDLITRVNALGKFDKVVDWGCGPYSLNPISAAVLNIECSELISVDIFNKYREAVLQKPRVATKHTFINKDILDLSNEMVNSGEKTNLSICLDVIEHLPQEEAVQFLENLKLISGVILIWIPLGDAPIEGDSFGHNNMYMKHLSTWSAKDLRALGYKVQIIKDFHTERFGHRVDGGWAWHVN